MSRHLASLCVIGIAMLTAMATSLAPERIEAEIVIAGETFVITNSGDVPWEDASLFLAKHVPEDTNPVYGGMEIGTVLPGEQSVVAFSDTRGYGGHSWTLEPEDLPLIVAMVECTINGGRRASSRRVLFATGPTEH